MIAAARISRRLALLLPLAPGVAHALPPPGSGQSTSVEAPSGESAGVSPTRAVEAKTPGVLRPWVVVHLVGEMRSAELEQALRSWFTSDEYRLTIFNEARLERQNILRPDDLYEVRVWIARRGNRVLLYLARGRSEPGKRRYLTRTVGIDGELGVLEVEKLAQVSHFATSALLDGRLSTPEQEFYGSLEESFSDSDPDSAGNRTEGGSASPTGPKTESEQDLVYLRLGDDAASDGAQWDTRHQLMLDVALRSRGEEPLAWGPGLSGALAWPAAGLQWGVLLRAHYLVPSTTTHERVEFEFSGFSGYAGPLLVHRAEHFAFQLSAGAALDRITLQSRSGEASLQSVNVGPSVRPALGAEAGFFWTPGTARIGLTAFLRWQLRKTQYEVAGPVGELAGGSRQLFAPAQLQPGVMLELGPNLD